MDLTLRRALLAALSSLAAPSLALAVDHAPRLVSAPEVALPDDDSLPSGASVRLEFTVSAEGHVQDAVVVEGLRPDLDAAVLEAASRMVFEPAEQGGRAMPARMRFRFRLRAPARSVIPRNPYEGDSAGLLVSPTTAPAVSAPTVTTPTVTAPVTAPTVTAPASDPEGGEATIRSRRQSGAATTFSLRGEELTTVPGTLGEPTRVVASMPGVARTPFGLGFFVVRGASFENTGFFIDGFPVPLLYHFGAGPAVISSRLVGQLDFFPGGYPLQYGRFSAGVISLETRPPPATRPFLEFSVDVLRASALAVVPFDHGRGSVAFAVRRSYLELIVPLIVDGVSLQYTDYQIRADYRFNARSKISLFAFGSNDTFSRSAAAGVGQTASEQQSELAYTFHRLIGRWDYGLPNRAQLSLAGTVGVDDTAFTNQVPGQQNQSFASTGFILGERATLRVPTGPHLTTSIGFDALTILFNADLQVPLFNNIGSVPPPAFDPVILDFSPRITQLSIAGWLEEVLRAGPVEFTAGLRVDRLKYAYVDTVVADPRAVLRVRLHERVVANIASGFFHQQPPFFNLVPGVQNPRLRPQRSWQTSAGVELNLPGSIETRFTGYYSRMYRLIRNSSDVIATPDGPQRVPIVDDGEGRAYGLEVLIRRRLDHGVYGWISYTLSRSERFVGDGTVVPFNFDQTHVLNLALSWDINPHWRVGGRFQLASGAPRRIVSGAFYDADIDRYRAINPPRVSDGSDTERLPVYHQLDVRVDYRFRWGPWRMSAYLDVINVYYAQNVENWLYQYDYAARTAFPGLPILPALGLTGEY
jgi:TonB family protein